MNEPEPATQPEDIRRKIEEKEAVTRGTLWEQMGCPQSKLHMPIDEYLRSHKGRHWFVNGTVLTQAQMALRIILCPKCYTEKDFGIEGTQFFMTVEDDVMTVFPAVGHFVCHWCGFEEWHPLKQDPRVQIMAGDGQHRHTNQVMPNIGRGQALGGMFGSAGLANQLAQVDPSMINQQALANQIGKAIGAGIQPGMGPIYGMTEDERRSLYRLYQQTSGKQAPPPKIVESKEEAELLLRLAPVERRQAIIQKLRDLGKI